MKCSMSSKLFTRTKILIAVPLTLLLLQLYVMPAQAEENSQPEAKILSGNFTFDPPIFQNFYEGTTMSVLVVPTDCYSDVKSVSLSVTLTDPRLAKVKVVRSLPPGTPRNDKFSCAERGEDTTCWRFVVAMEAVQLGLTPAIMKLTLPAAGAQTYEIQQVSGSLLSRSSVLRADQNQASDDVIDVTTTRVKARVMQVQFDVVVSREPRPIDDIFLLFLMIFVTLLNLGFGCSLNLDLVAKILKRPIAPAIGFGCQFCFMPLLSFSITSLLPINRMLAFGLLVLGCSPGGGGSNVWTLLLKGNVDLSITMTFISICCCLFMMPFWLYTLSSYYVDPTKVSVPFNEIFKTLLAFVIPCVIGIVLRKKKPRAADACVQLMKPLSLGFIVYILTFGLYVNAYIYRMMATYPLIVPAAFLLPWCGFGVGFLVATILRQPRPSAVTIAIETGIQNYSIAMVVLFGAFPKPYGDLAAVMPLIVAHFTPLPLFTVFLILTIRDKIIQRKRAKAAAAAGLNITADDTGDLGDVEIENRKLTKDEESGEAALLPREGQGQGNNDQQVRSWTFLEVGDGYVIGRKTAAYIVDKREIVLGASTPPTDSDGVKQSTAGRKSRDQVENLWYKCLKESNI